MPVEHPTINEPRYNAIQWTGDNADEIYDALNTGEFVGPHNFNVYVESRPNLNPGPTLMIEDANSGDRWNVTLGSWVVGAPYYSDTESSLLHPPIEVLREDEYQAKFGDPEEDEEEVYP